LLFDEGDPLRKPAFLRIAAASAVCLALLAFASVGRCQSLTLKNLVVDNQAGSIMVRFGVGVDGVQGIVQSLESGATLGLRCQARLVQEHFWYNAKISSTDFVSLVRWDALTKEYVLELPGREQPLQDKDIQELFNKAWDQLTLDLGSWSALQRGDSYSLRLEIRLSRSDIPAWLRYSLFFWSWDVIQPTTYRLDFTY
jgi:hypothetical protein